MNKESLRTPPTSVGWSFNFNPEESKKERQKFNDHAAKAGGVNGVIVVPQG